ncbi:MAG: hypothetical protein ACLRPU_20715 [Enterococcus hulanensis]
MGLRVLNQQPYCLITLPAARYYWVQSFSLRVEW